MNIDALLWFFLGDPPVGEYAYMMYYTARLLIGILLFNALFDIFRFVRSFVRPRR